ncbi:9345_t:CDS:2 [Rhizophagus irregularis]|nr:9345_t:CDS:2 [Rhizophagus irregularis]
MDLDEEFDNCDELFDFSDTEMCAEQTDDKEYNDLSDNTAGVVEEGLDLIESLNTLKIDKSDWYNDNIISNWNSDDNIFHPSISIPLYSLIINNFTIKTEDTCSIAINPVTQAICFISNNEENKFRLDIHVNGITKYERFGRLIEMQLRHNIRKWIIPVRRIIDKDNIEISMDPTNGEIYNSNMILATVSVHENFCNLEAMDAVYEYANHGIIGIRDEEDWENFKEVMKKNYDFNNNVNKERIEMWVGKN